MSWFTDFITAIGRMSGFVIEQAEQPHPAPVPITTREELGWDDVPGSDEEPTQPGNHKPPKAAA